MKRKNISYINIWPGFVDAISTLLLVFVFLLAVLMISENFLTQAISGKDTALNKLRDKMLSLELDLQKKNYKNLKLSELLSSLNEQLDRLNIEKNKIENDLVDQKSINKNLQFDLEDIESKLSVLYDEPGMERLNLANQKKTSVSLNLMSFQFQTL